MSPATPDQTSSRDRKGLRIAHGTIALLTMAVALPIALVGGMALIGGWLGNVWVRLAIALIVLLIVPLVIADRLLPKDPEDPSKRRPGLVRDVLAASWALVAIAFVGLAGSLSGAPLRAEAGRLDEHGWARAAWLGRYVAEPDPEVAPATDDEAGEPETEVALAKADEAKPDDAKPDAAKPDAAKPDEAKPDEAKPDDAKPDEAKPDAAKPDAAKELSPAELFSSYAPAVVSIKIEHGGFRSGGTGFFIDDQGTLATNHHVIDGAREVRIKLLDGTELDRVELLASNETVDLALLRVDPKDLPEPPVATELGDSEAIQVGEPVSVIGNPLGLDHTLTNGIVSARRVYEGERYIQMSAPISPGNSGGPVFDRHGKVIGVSVAQMVGGQNLNLAVPVSQLRAMISEDYPNRRSFGASSW